MNFSEKIITQNGLYNATDENLKGYHKLTIDVQETTGLPTEINNEVVEIQPPEEITDVTQGIQHIFPNPFIKTYTIDRPTPYLVSTGTQFIDTGIVLVTGDRVEIDFQYLSNTNDRWVFGTSNFQAGIYSNSLYTSSGFTYNQSDRLTRTIATGKCTNNQTLTAYLFARNHTTTAYRYPSHTKVFYCKIWDAEGNLKANFIPTLSQEEGHENEACMFDTVSQTYFYNQGSGTFTIDYMYDHITESVIGENISPMTNLSHLDAQFNYQWQRGNNPQIYLESTGAGAYINTHIKPNQDYKIEMLFRHTNIINSYEIPFGSRTSSTSNCFAYFQRTNSVMTTKTLSYNNGETAIPNMPEFYKVITKVTMRGNYLELESDNEYKDIGRPEGTFTCTVPLTIFGCNTNGSIQYFTPMQLFYFKIWDENNELVRDFVPSLSEEEGHINEPCLFDNVDKIYYYNTGTSNFTIGYESLDYSDIEGATDNNYTSTTEDLNKCIKCKLTGYGNCEQQNLESLNVLIIEGDDE